MKALKLIGNISVNDTILVALHCFNPGVYLFCFSLCILTAVIKVIAPIIKLKNKDFTRFSVGIYLKPSLVMEGSV
ncbi:hypothetical protein EG351_17285 [Chryseobacterium bernardetii]|nr:hypothetical protein EG351_17285 [Chryseobacterium bernardetii]